MNCTLPTSYFGNINYFSKFIDFENIYIEAFDNFQKQTFRNRCEIYSANGRLALTVPVVKNHNQKTFSKDVRIDYNENWQKNHFKAFESAYRSTPYYQYYIDDFMFVFKNKYNYLIDLNNLITNTVLDILKIENTYKQTTEYVEIVDNDFRQILSSKHKKNNQFIQELKYNQVFVHKFSFIENLSIVDLIFNMGTDSKKLFYISFF